MKYFSIMMRELAFSYHNRKDGDFMRHNNQIGKCVTIIDKDSSYYNHWGYIIAYDGLYHVSGGSIASSSGEVAPVFDRDQLRIHRK